MAQLSDGIPYLTYRAVICFLGNEMRIPFDDNSGEKYTLEIFAEQIGTSDGIVLTLNKKACKAFADIFNQLALSDIGSHIHLGYDESEPQGPGFRLVLDDNT